MYIKLAWRNLWRNKRRTIITVASVMLAVMLSTLMRCMQLGTYDKMIENVVGFYSGYIQISSADFNEEPNIDNGFELTDTILNVLNDEKSITAFAPRQESFVWLSSDSASKGAFLIGAFPDKEEIVTSLSDKVVKGKYFTADSRDLLLAEGVAEKLKVDVGDTIVLIGQGYHGLTAAGKFPVGGILSFGSPDLNKRMVYMPIREMKELTGGDVVTSVSLMLENNRDLPMIDSKLQQKLGSDFAVKTWKEIMPELEQAIQADNAGGLIMAGVLYFIIAFGIFGTLLMMLAERMREFGMLISLGMKNIWISIVVIIESFLIGLLGTLAGMTFSIPLVAWFFYHPIRFTGEVAEGYASYGFEPVMFVSSDPSIFISQALLVFSIMLALSLFPFIRILRIKPVEAMRR